MLRFLTRRPKPASVGARRARLELERLEGRDIPSTLTLNVTYDAGRTVTLSGDLTNTPNPAGHLIQLYGQASGSTITDANGHYSITLKASGLGKVGAVLRDDFSTYATATLTDTAPVITSFQAIEEQNHIWEFKGTVTWNRPFGSMIIDFGGQPVSIQNQSTTAKSTGSFDLCLQLNGKSTDNGTVGCWALDCWGVQSQVAMAMVHQTGT
jgi:hypothetical protein